MSLPLRSRCRLFSLLLIFAACGDDSTPVAPDGPVDAPVDAAPDANTADALCMYSVGDGSADAIPAECASGSAGVTVGPLTELPFLPAPAANCAYNTDFEASVAAKGGHVVIGHINLAINGPSTYCSKRVALSISHDSGMTFAAPLDVPNSTSDTTDPVLQVDATGQFWLSRLTSSTSQACILASSADHGTTWRTVADGLACDDKEWMVVDSTNQAVYGCAYAGCWKVGFDGSMLAQSSSRGDGCSGYADGAGAHFFRTTSNPVGIGPADIQVWNGTGDPVLEGNRINVGPDANLFNYTGTSLGRTADGGQWIIRAVRTGNLSSLVLRVRHLPGDEGTDIPIGTAGEVAILPSAALDATGKLHVVWYDSACANGVLKYAHSLTSALVDGFTPAQIIDPNATPGMGWYPYYVGANADRRLREYIGIAVDGNRAFIAWTHAPSCTSRIWTTYVDF
jgi:hypothetical protein